MSMYTTVEPNQLKRQNLRECELALNQTSSKDKCECEQALNQTSSKDKCECELALNQTSSKDKCECEQALNQTSSKDKFTRSNHYFTRREPSLLTVSGCWQGDQMFHWPETVSCCHTETCKEHNSVRLVAYICSEFTSWPLHLTLLLKKQAAERDMT